MDVVVDPRVGPSGLSRLPPEKKKVAARVTGEFPHEENKFK